MGDFFRIQQDRFELQRSENGQSWATIGQVGAQGDAAVEARYFFQSRQLRPVMTG